MSNDCITCTHFLSAKICKGGDYPGEAMEKHGYKGSCARPNLFMRVVELPNQGTSCGFYKFYSEQNLYGKYYKG